MKNSPLTTILLGVLTISALCSLIFFGLFVSRNREINRLKSEVAEINNRQNLMRALMYDANEYSKKNPAINPILHKSVGGQTNKPAAK
jgi:hypothetical protein